MENNTTDSTQKDVKSVFAFKIKFYYIIILYVILALIIVSLYIIGYSKKYDNEYVAEVFAERDSSFDELTQARSVYADYALEAENLKSEISDMQLQSDALSEFESNREAYNEEIQELSDQVNTLTAQKAEKQQTLNNIELELSQY